MRIALLFSGQIRVTDIEVFKRSLFLFINNYEYDIYISSWDKTGKSLNHNLNNLNKNGLYDNICVSDYINNMFSGFNVKKINLENFIFWKENLHPDFKIIQQCTKYSIFFISN